jgi:hypothetical protein
MDRVTLSPLDTQQLTHTQSSGSRQQNQCAFPCIELGEKKLKFCEFENIRNGLVSRRTAKV